MNELAREMRGAGHQGAGGGPGAVSDDLARRVEAERALVGCVLLDPTTVIPGIVKVVGVENPFYELTLGTVWQVCRSLYERGEVVDLVLVAHELRGRSELVSSGGIVALHELADCVPSASNWDYYLNLVWEGYLARTAAGVGSVWTEKVRSRGELTEGLIGELEREVDGLKVLSARQLKLKPKRLSAPVDHEEGYYEKWFKHSKEEPGWELPFPFPLRIRGGEMTLFTGDNGAGKSSFLGQMCLVLAKQGARVVMASMEVRPEVTLWMLARQLLGRGQLNEDEEGKRQAADALGWLQERVRLYDFLGIAEWRDLLDTFGYAAEEQGFTVFVVDSVMRIGVEEDDYAMQAHVAKCFADFAVKRNVHLISVNHENKGEGGMKQKVAGTKKWTDNAHNVLQLMRNAQKADLLEEWREKLEAGQCERAEYDATLEKQRVNWDGKLKLGKQRWPGSQQNAARYLWFDRPSLQFRCKPALEVMDYRM